MKKKVSPRLSRSTTKIDNQPVATRNLQMVAHQPQDLVALLEGTAEYEKASGMRVAEGVREFLLAASPEFIAQLQSASTSDPWKFGFAVVHKIDHVVIGMCGFTGPPDQNRTVEIAYGIVTAYQGQGYATEAATALIDYAINSGRVRTIRAHTLPETNASTRVLEKCGFSKIGDIRDSENNLVWQWEKTVEAKWLVESLHNALAPSRIFAVVDPR